MNNIIVAGGRVGRNLSKAIVWAVLDDLSQRWPNPFRIVHGAAAWTDTWAGQWGYDRHHPVQPVPVDGNLDGYKDRAPFRRNMRMQRDFPAYLCLGFPGGGGTNSMLEICHDAGVPVGDVEINDNGTWRVNWWPMKQS
jgi:hypothetical protein